MSTLKIDIKPGETINIGDDVELSMERKSGQVARLSITAPKNVNIQHNKAEKTSDAEYAAKFGLMAV